MKYEVISLDSLAKDGKLKGYDTLAEFLCQFLCEKANGGWEFVAAVPFLNWQSCLIFKQVSTQAD